MIDIHNFARWNGGIIGQGGPTDEQFVSLWSQLATKYAGSEKVVFELMNEPHHLDVQVWAATCQKVITAIRQAGAVKQMILLPGSNFDSAATLVTAEGGAEALMALTNPDGSIDNLLLDIHKYLDSDNSGTRPECVTNNTDAFGQVAAFLRKTGRKGIVSETGAAVNIPDCMSRFCEQNSFINANSDVFLGLVAWAAGSFDSSYILSMTPSRNNGKLENNALGAQCVVGTWKETPEDVKPGNSSIISSSPARSTTVSSTSTTTTRSTTTSEPAPSTSHSGAWTMIITVGTPYAGRPRPTTDISTSTELLLTAPSVATGVGNSGGRSGGDGDGLNGGNPNTSPSSTQPVPGVGAISKASQLSTMMLLVVAGVVGFLF